MLSSLRQTTTVRAYYTEFMKIANRLPDWPVAALVGTFKRGLRQEISDEMRHYPCHTMRDVVRHARIEEEKLARQ